MANASTWEVGGDQREPNHMADESSWEVDGNQRKPNRVDNASTWEVGGDQREPSRVADAAFSTVVESDFSKLPRQFEQLSADLEVGTSGKTSSYDGGGSEIEDRRIYANSRFFYRSGSAWRFIWPGTSSYDCQSVGRIRMSSEDSNGCDAASKNRSAEMVHLQAMFHLCRLVPMLVAPWYHCCSHKWFMLSL